MNTDGRLAAVEAIVGKTETAARDSAEALWTDGVYAALIDAKTTAQEGHETDFWHWRWFERWEKGGRTGDHKGTDGCPTG